MVLPPVVALLVVPLLGVLPDVPAPPGLAFDCGAMESKTLLDVTPVSVPVGNRTYATSGHRVDVWRSDSCVGVESLTYGVYCTQAGDYWNGQVLVYSSAHGCHALYLVRVPRPA